MTRKRSATDPAQVHAAPVCPKYTSDGCAACTKETWLEGLKNCGFCHDPDKQGCLDGTEGGPWDNGKCENWEWYDRGVPGGKVGKREAVLFSLV